ncbi:UMP kinase [Candidatus Bipolaricaulota bacterium]|nr:UMP kinase [Candidatus Bipolaricaulota bacterium]
MSAPSRLLLKLSGGAFKGEEGAFSPVSIRRITEQITSLGSIELGIVIGGGNIIRGAKSPWLDRIEADTLGMLATVLNGLALRSYIERSGREAIVQSAVSTELTEPISPQKARRALANGQIVIFVGGTGNPLVTTDTAAAIRAISIGATLLVKGSNVPGVFTEDPSTGRDPRLLPEVSFEEFITHRYGVMDLVAVQICREHNLPIIVFDLEEEGAWQAIAQGKTVGTLIH